jgi:hypothetical protein
MTLQEKLFDLVTDMGLIPIITSDIAKIRILNQDKTIIGEFTIIDNNTLSYRSCLKKQSSGSCSFDEIGIISIINKFI